MATLTIFKTLDPRPADIPAEWIVMNAPRPLVGDREWQGEFRHGIFYVAFDPAGPFATRTIRQNAELDGWGVDYIQQAEIDAWVDAECERRGYDRDKIKPESGKESFFNRMGRSTDDAEDWMQRRLEAA